MKCLQQFQLAIQTFIQVSKLVHKMSPTTKVFCFFFVALASVNSHPVDNSLIDEPQSSPQSDMIDLSSFGTLLFGEPDESVGNAVNDWTPEGGMNPEELGTYLEGDMLVPGVEGRNGLVKASSKWPNAVVPYVISPSFGNIISF